MTQHRERIYVETDPALSVPGRLGGIPEAGDPGRLTPPETGELGRLGPETPAAAPDIKAEARNVVDRVVQTLDDEKLTAAERNAMLDSVADKLIPGQHNGHNYLTAQHPDSERPFVMQNAKAARVAEALRQREEQKAAEAAKVKSELAAASAQEAADQLARTDEARRIISQVTEPAESKPTPAEPAQAEVPEWPIEEPDAVEVTPAPQKVHVTPPERPTPVTPPVQPKQPPKINPQSAPLPPPRTETIPKPPNPKVEAINKMSAQEILSTPYTRYVEDHNLSPEEVKVLEKRVVTETVWDMDKFLKGEPSARPYTPKMMLDFVNLAEDMGYAAGKNATANLIRGIHQYASGRVMASQPQAAARTAAQQSPRQQAPIHGAEAAGSPADGATQPLPGRQPAPNDPPTMPISVQPPSPAEQTMPLPIQAPKPPVANAETVAAPGSYATNYYAPMHYEGPFEGPNDPRLMLKQRLTEQYNAQMKKQGGVKAHKALENLIEGFKASDTVEQKGTAIESLLDGLTFTGLNLEQAQKAKGRLLDLGKIHGLTMDQRIMIGFKVASAQDAINFYVGEPTPNSPREERSETYMQAYEHFVNGPRGFYKPLASDKATGMHKFDEEDLALIRGPLAGDYRALGLIVELPKDRISNKVRKEAKQLLSRHFALMGESNGDIAQGVEASRDRREKLLGEEDFSAIFNDRDIPDKTKQLVWNAKLLLEARRYNEFIGDSPFDGMTKKQAKAALKVIQKREKELITNLIAADQKDVVARFRANIPYTNKSYLYNASLAQDLPFLAGLPNKTRQQIIEEARYAKANPVVLEPNDFRAVGANQRNPGGIRNGIRSLIGLSPKIRKDKFGR